MTEHDPALSLSLVMPLPAASQISTYKRTGSFGRLPSLGLVVQPLVNPSLRKYAFSAAEGGGGVKAGADHSAIAIPVPEAAAGHRDGVLVVEVEPLSCSADLVQVGDILMALDGVAISEAGDVVFRGHERLPFQYIISRKSEGETMQLKLLRADSPPTVDAASTAADAADAADLNSNKSSSAAAAAARPRTRSLVEVEVKLTPPPRWLPALLGSDYHADYAILGGLVVLVAGSPLIQYILQSGSRGYGNEVRLVETMRNVSEELYTEPGAECLLVSGILAHALNVGCNWCYAKRLDTFNGAAIKNVKHFTDLIVGCTEPYIVLGFHGTKKNVVFETALVRSTQNQILDQHKVPQWKSRNNSGAAIQSSL